MEWQFADTACVLQFFSLHCITNGKYYVMIRIDGDDGGFEITFEHNVVIYFTGYPALSNNKLMERAVLCFKQQITQH